MRISADADPLRWFLAAILLAAQFGCASGNAGKGLLEETCLSEVTVKPPGESADLEEMVTAVESMKGRQRKYFPEDAVVDSIVSGAARTLTAAVVQSPETTVVRKNPVAGYLLFGSAVAAGAALGSGSDNLAGGLALGTLSGAALALLANRNYRTGTTDAYRSIRDSLAPYFRGYNEAAVKRVREDSVLARRALENAMADTPEKLAEDMEFFGRGLGYAAVAYVCLTAVALIWFVFGDWH